MKISKSFVHTDKPSPRLVQPQISKRTQKRKTPFLCTFLDGAKTDVFTSKTQKFHCQILRRIHGYATNPQPMSASQQPY